VTRLRAGLLVCVVLACGPSGEVPPAIQRLLPDATRVALGPESRPASGPARVGVFHGEVPASAARSRLVGLPAAAASGRFVVLRSVERAAAEPPPLAGPAPRRVQVQVAEVEGDGGRPRALLRLGPALVEGASRLWVEALPVPDASRQTLSFALRVPAGATLAFGYGLREESWTRDGRPAAFRVALVEPGGRRHALFEAVLDPREPPHRRWFDAEVDLAAWAGRDATLELIAERSGGPGALSLPVWGDPAIYAPGDAALPPDVVLISLDTLRARSLGAYGYARDTSPFFDALAAQGTLFTRAVTTAVSTSPSHMSLFTGLYPVRHGVLAGMGHRAAGVRMLAEILRERGYTTAAFAENGYVDQARFAPGFARFTENAADSRETPGFARRTFAQARDWLERGPRRPFFLFVHTYEVHSPYDPPESHAGLFAGDGHPGPDHALLRRHRDDYDREIRALDDELRSFFEALRESAVGDTIAVVVADHGEEFGEHGRSEHGGAVFEETLRVPLLFWGPGRIPAGARRDERVSLIDVVPTLLEMLGLPAPPDLDGVSLAPGIRVGAPIRDRTLFAEARTQRDWLRDFETVRWETPLFAVMSADTKFVVQRPRRGPRPPILRYDLERDPDERAPQALDAAQAAEVDRLLDSYLAAAAGSDAAPGPDDSETLEPDLRDRLRALGYAQ
jgi:arylsulfatase A-like enzyme